MSCGVTAPKGFVAAGVHCGLKKRRLDLSIIASTADEPSTLAAVFTRNQVQAAPVLYCREVLAGGRARAIVANSGNANACTGEPGLADTRAMAERAGAALDMDPGHVLVASTGVIGVPMPMPTVLAGIDQAATELRPGGGVSAAEGILTTDTRPKIKVEKVSLGGGEVTIGGIAKGAGMMAPDMATTLAFVTTDVKASPAALDLALRTAVEPTFNSITVDGDTSTNDCILLLANGAAGVEAESADDLEGFTAGLQRVLGRLAVALIADAEGANRVIEIRVKGARTDAAARQVANTIANSPLVKTAYRSGQPNWGRFMGAIGRAGVDIVEQRIGIAVLADGERVEVVRGGLGVSDNLEGLARTMLADHTVLEVDLGLGGCRWTVWTCDLSEGYIEINASYIS
ncbi:MAG: bifunctional glutamate N-acetyltransferase/amino-acid acetyltransferase ArgJ [Holophagales bacterium]|nr:bifunctional glutamate N-acetyltransferase/amino-acid acetyltransferase ArgJ [Holophagales bacterium]MYF03899.1 bifunctional glutamate N-acetyltransferase/amino-acid acetyltransferase ArgJ [Holophagales bacterium]MYJ25969.1 bifunctional glutamate N-acetyltransferase/amino-acid acetyltransferase ArgJ [Holophagales bacterium]